MTNEPYLLGTFDGDQMHIMFSDEGVTINVVVTVESAAFADMIEVDLLSDGILRFYRVVQLSNWHMYSFLLVESSIRSTKMSTSCWERGFGGSLYICLPPTVDWGLMPEVVE